MKTIGFSEADVSFMDELRYFRNGIKYYGRRLNKEYALQAIDFMKRAVSKLKRTFSF